ncbi:MAG: heparinase II/III family protein [Spirochaetales bacterium]|nr:heparinase II/III family protein [Spirochaetales bacterium]
MKFTDINKIRSLAAESSVYAGFIKQIRLETDEYFSRFSDSPAHISRWAHHYFCKEEGGRLIYDDRNPDSHVCSICGRSYSNELLTGVWYTMYRNQGVVNAWKSSLLFALTSEQKYLNYLVDYTRYYNKHYLEFKLHNKEGFEFDSQDEALWGCSRIMPQSLNESIFLIRLVNALELVRSDLPDGLISELEEGIFSEAYKLFIPQVDKIHNIPTWLNCGIAVMGFFLGNDEMCDFALKGKMGLEAQLKEGVTSDFFWYEGSIHYNFFLLEGIVNMLLFAELKGYDFSFAKDTAEKMLLAAYSYAFDNHRLPNPNDGWPDVNLKTYSYVYSIAVKVLGADSPVVPVLGSILNQDGERGTVPLSKPYYYKNDMSLEELLFAPEVREGYKKVLKQDSVNFRSSYCALLKSGKSNVFLKYGHNGPSHAHPDKMGIEVILGGVLLSRDLSNSGYGNALCNEWHRVSASHNTVVVNGEDHKGFEGGLCLFDDSDHIRVDADNVYPGVKYSREIWLQDSSFDDRFTVSSVEEGVFDYLFHVEGALVTDLESEEGELNYKQNGYQHFKEVRKILHTEDSMKLKWLVRGYSLECTVNLKNTELFIMKSLDNPVIHYRTSFMLRQRGMKADFFVKWKSPS